MRKLILRSQLSPGDIVMLTAAVRDLHRSYPGRFVTDVRTSCPALWEHNPYLTPLAEGDRDVEAVDCAYPLIDRSNQCASHCLHGFIDFLNDRLGLRIRLTDFRGDIHLSDEEKSWASQVQEWTGHDAPFWVVAAGGKHDITIKWWSTERYQAVVDHFRGRIQFAQVGCAGHYHPRLERAIDLRGRTSLRELVRLVYHAQGILCGVTSLMHLAAAVESKNGGIRPCVVIAGGREPAHWEAYPGHQFIAMNGALPCCLPAGCWRSRTRPLGDGDLRDDPANLCFNVVGELPRCMDMIDAQEAARRVELHFTGGVVRYLRPGEHRAAQRGAARSATNDYDQAPLTRSSARIACEHFIRHLPSSPGTGAGRGVVICGGGLKYFTNAWVCLRMLRHLGCRLPIELWYRGRLEMDEAMKRLVAPLGVICVDAAEVERRWPVRRHGGWELKPYAILHSRFREVLFLDADNVSVRDPAYLFDSGPYLQTGAVFWPDLGRLEKTEVIWESCGLERPPGPEFESGQMVVDKGRCWPALRLALWFNEHSDFYYQHLYGDKETFHLAFHKLRKSYGFVPTPVQRLEGTMCQHDFEGRRLFQHRNTDKWNLFLRNRRVPDFWLEDECRRFVQELAGSWDGRMAAFRPRASSRSRRPTRGAREVTIEACMISCAERAETRARTLQELAATDWGSAPVCVVQDRGEFECHRQRQTHTAWRALRACLDWSADFVLFLEDDLEFNRHLRHNLMAWNPVRRRAATLAGLYNPGLPSLACDPRNQVAVVAPEAVFGSQAFLLSRPTLEHVVAHWEEVEGMQDIRMSRLAGQLGTALHYHAPSLVQHVGEPSVWGGRPHQAWDFEPHWRA